MEHIIEQYGQKTNYLSLTSEELKQLEPFLNALGVRVRTMQLYHDGENWIHEIQAQNPYQKWSHLYSCENAIKQADSDMSCDGIRRYKL